MINLFIRILYADIISHQENIVYFKLIITMNDVIKHLNIV